MLLHRQERNLVYQFPAIRGLHRLATSQIGNAKAEFPLPESWSLQRSKRKGDVNRQIFSSPDDTCIARFGRVNVVWTAPDPSTQREGVTGLRQGIHDLRDLEAKIRPSLMAKDCTLE